MASRKHQRQDATRPTKARERRERQQKVGVEVVEVEPLDQDQEVQTPERA